MIKDRSFMPRYLEILEKTSRIMYENMASSTSNLQAKNLKVESFSATQADAGHKISFEALYTGTSVKTKIIIVRIARGRAMLEFFISNLNIDDKRIASIAEQVFSRLNERKIAY